MILLGSTGSIGVATLEVATMLQHRVEALAAGRNIALLNQQIAAHKPTLVAIADARDLGDLEPRGARVFVGGEGICELLECAESPLVVNAIVGFAGLQPSLYAQSCKKKLALANKESLVAGGWLLDRGAIVPIDSEHFGLWYLQSEREVKRLIITASGGAFRDMPLEQIGRASKEEALRHPNWQMGQKITVDSASMMNKIFEILEAYWLFGCKDLEAFIERSSSIHALVEYLDGSTTAHFALPDMRLPIAYALDSKQAARRQIIPSVNLGQIRHLCFEPIDERRYPLYALKDRVLENPRLGVVINASNERAVSHFLRDGISFGLIGEAAFAALERFASSCVSDMAREESFGCLESRGLDSHGLDSYGLDSMGGDGGARESTGVLASYEAIAALDREVRLWCDEWLASKGR